MEKILKFKGKKINMEYYIDGSYRPYGDGTPQYRKICKFDGRVVFDNKLGIEEITSTDFYNLQNYAYNIGAYDREVNCYGRYDLTYSFRIM